MYDKVTGSNIFKNCISMKQAFCLILLNSKKAFDMCPIEAVSFQFLKSKQSAQQPGYSCQISIFCPFTQTTVFVTNFDEMGAK